MSQNPKSSFLSDSQIKYFVLFLWLSISLHAYLFLFGYHGILSMLRDSSPPPRPKSVELQNIILETAEETLKKDEDALISDKNTFSAAPNPNLNQKEEYNFFNHNVQKTITFEQKARTSTSEAEEEIKKMVESQLATIQKPQPQNETQKQSEAGSPSPSMYDPDQEVVVNLYNVGTPSLATHSKEFAEYLLKMREKIAIYHKEFFPIHLYFQGLTKNGTVVVEFILNQEGEIVASQITQSIGMETIDNASLNSIRYAKNFGPLPEELAQNGSVKINFHFVYHRR